jgi:hypothetical protein
VQPSGVDGEIGVRGCGHSVHGEPVRVSGAVEDSAELGRDLGDGVLSHLGEVDDLFDHPSPGAVVIAS